MSWRRLTPSSRTKSLQQTQGTRTILGTPLLREGIPIGVILIRRTEVRPFTDKQIDLLKTFADQAVIAIENVRLFKELQARNRNCARPWSIRRQRPRCLAIISRSPTDVQPVLDAIVESAARVCGIDDVVLRLHEGNTWLFYGLILVPYSRIPGRVEVSIDEPRFRGCASTAAP